MTTSKESMDLDAARQKLHGARGPEYWRSLEELSQSETFLKLLQDEFPRQAGDWVEGMSRRRFLSLMGASLALAGLTGCSQAPREQIVPYVRAPEEIVPGRSLYFATSMPLTGYGKGLLVESHMGRPTKVEGNPDHPASPKPFDAPPAVRFGPTDIFAQASVLTLYDPDRSQTVTHLGEIGTWEDFMSAFRGLVQEHGNKLRLRLLTGSVTSPTTARQVQLLRERFPEMRWHIFEPAGPNNARLGALHAFGRHVATQYNIRAARVILSLEADFLGPGPRDLVDISDFTLQRKGWNNAPTDMNRLYVVESCPTITGAKADHRLALRSSQIESFARTLAQELGIQTGPAEHLPPHGVSPQWIHALAEDLRAQEGLSLVLAGESQMPFVHALVHAINHQLKNVGRTISYTNPVDALPTDNFASLKALAEDMKAGRVDALFIIGGNPVYDAPADVEFVATMEHVPFRAHLSLHDDETSAACHWHLPEAHFLESWGDVRAYDGTVSLIQPLIAPLYEGKSAYELLAILNDQPERAGYDIVRRYWRSLFDTADPWHRAVRASWQELGLLDAFRGNFESWWRTALHDGVIRNTELPRRQVTLQTNWREAAGFRPQPGDQTLEIVFRPDPTIFDGRFANNGWLQELPKRLTSLTWDNAALMSPGLAVRLGLAPAGHPEQANEKMVALEYRGRPLEVPVWIVPGHAEDSITLSLGHGRSRGGRVAVGVGFSAYTLRTSMAPWFDTGLSARVTGRRHPLAATRHHHLMENRHPVWSGTLAEMDRLAQEMQASRRRPLSLYAEHGYPHNKWGMVIDTNACVGCGACIVACQAENNIPIVGKDQVSRGREMHWLRVDTYYKGEMEQPDRLETYFQPVPCMQCENAPCELVCPVGATTHSSDGLNDMVYNRCVGTRYCSNNCPYKVRRFNFLEYSDNTTESLRLQRNPDVTVRSRGVMEKCTYCVQRIRRGQIESRREGHTFIADGEIVTACQAVCPAGAITFGDLNRGDSQVTQKTHGSLHYALLEELNTQPRTTYLAALRNPNPAMLRIEARAQ
jgi:MoCo/4Fe-4S cofactor protein with predicted Tat translocation signal